MSNFLYEYIQIFVCVQIFTNVTLWLTLAGNHRAETSFIINPPQSHNSQVDSGIPTSQGFFRSKFKIVLSDALALHTWHFCNSLQFDTVNIVDIAEITDIIDIVDIFYIVDIVGIVDIVDIINTRLA